MKMATAAPPDTTHFLAGLMGFVAANVLIVWALFALPYWVGRWYEIAFISLVAANLAMLIVAARTRTPWLGHGLRAGFAATLFLGPCTCAFNAAFPGFDTDVHGLVDDEGEGLRRYCVDCVRVG